MTKEEKVKFKALRYITNDFSKEQNEKKEYYKHITDYKRTKLIVFQINRIKQQQQTFKLIKRD